jgi:DNA mismatch endonuclease (patch repair protein)
MDRISPEKRSANMARIRSANTTPEMAVRRAAFALGYRFRLHRASLPGKPDLVFGPRRKIVFVHGCYWHGHGCRVGGTGAKSNQGYWGPKIARNRERDRTAVARLQDQGWKVLVVWESETKDPENLAQRLRSFLGDIVK